MRTTTLGHNGPGIGVIGLGCMGMSHAYDRGGRRDEDTSIAVIRQALDLGMTLIDTADVYGPFVNEDLVGRALSGGHREAAVLATKVGLITLPTGTAAGSSGTAPNLGRDARPDHIRRAIDDSLRRLNTDHVDLYQLHRIDPQVPLEDSWGAMAETVTAGKALHIGLSEVSVEEIGRAQAIHPVASVQSELSLWTRDALADVVPYCARRGIAFLPFSPLGRGFLTGRFTSFDDLPDDDFRRDQPRFQPDALLANLAIVERVRRIADQIGATPAQVALAWVLAQGAHVVPIPGTKTPTYLSDNAGAADVSLSAADLADLDALPEPQGGRY